MKHIINRSRKSILLTLALVLLLQNGSGLAQIDLPDIGDAAAAVATPQQEKKTGEAVMRNIRRGGGIISDPLIDDYLNHLGYKLIAAGNSGMTDFNFFVINDPNVNAFALPGGYIGVHYGLILATRSESELASVLAHEIAHVTQRHHTRAYEFGGNSNIPVLAAIIAAIVLGANNNEVGEAAMASIAAGSVQRQINFTRANEKEADHIGIELLANAGFDPNSMAGFFEQLHKATRLYGPQAPEFLRTHPVNETRIADAQSRAAHFQPRMTPDSTAYHLMRARIQVLTSQDLHQTRQRFAENLQAGRFLNKHAERYGYALSLIATDSFDAAEAEIQTLLKAEPQRLAYQLAKADLQYQRGQVQQAMDLYAEILKLFPDNPAVISGYVDVLLKNKQPGRAETLLQNFLRNPERDPQFYRLLARAQAEQNHQAQSQISLGEYYYRSGQTHQAITQFTLALKDPAIDFYASSRIEARLQELQSELAALGKSKSAQR